MGQVKRKQSLAPFNSPYELGIRMALLLYALRPNGADLQRLVLLDYAVVYSADLAGPPSLHTPVPQRNSELYSRRLLIQQGLYLMSRKGIIEARFDDQGISYIAGPKARHFINGLTADYSRELEKRTAWVAITFGSHTTEELMARFDRDGSRWGAEIETLTS